MPRTCPDDARLQQLLLGLLPADEAAPLEEHLDACPHCAARAESTSGADELIGAMRAGAGAAKSDERARVVQLAERLVRFREEVRAAEVSTLASKAASAHSASAQTLDLPPEIAAVLEPPQSADELGRLGSYRILDILGVGGMGVVFRAEERSQSRPAALKVIHPRLADHPEARPRFLRESRALAAVSDPHIVPLLAAGEAGGLLYLEMPLLQGETLEQRLAREEKLPAAEVVRIGREVAAGLAAAHAAGLIHRDLKPANVWLEAPGGRVKLLDFGLVHVEAEDEERLTASGVLLGTPGYMSPEQAKGEHIDFRADLFSLGCVLYKACTGQRPFRGDNVQEELAAVANHLPTAPQRVEATVPRELSDLILLLLAKEPAARPSSAAAVGETLRQHLEARNPPVPAPGRSFLLAGLIGLSLVLGGVCIWLCCRVNQLTRHSDPDPEAGDPVQALVRAADGNSYLLRNGILWRIDGSRLQQRIDAGGPVQALVQAVDGEAYVLRAGGIHHFDGAGFTRVLGGEVRTLTGVSGTPAWGTAVANLPDGTLLVAGVAGKANQYDFLLARYTPNGTLDRSFGNGGVVITDIGGVTNPAAALTVLPGQKILVAGYAAGPGGHDFALAQYNADGSLDAAFGTGGKVVTDLGGDDHGTSVQALSNGRILVAGNSGHDFALVCYRANGSLDTSFGAGGKVITDFGGPWERANAMVVQPDGRIVLVGLSPRSTADVALARYNADGSLDGSFGTGGKVRIDFGAGEYGNAVALSPDGKLVVAGRQQNPTGDDFLVARYNSDGSLDTTFGSNGVVIADLANGLADVATGVAVTPLGEVVVAGHAKSKESWKMVVARYAVDGSSVTSFGSGGKAIVSFGAGTAQTTGVTLQADGKIVIVGEASNGGSPQIALARLHADASLDSDLVVASLVRAADAQAYVLTGGSIYRFDGNKLTERIFSQGSIQSLTQAPDGNAYVLKNGTLFRFDGKALVKIETGGSAEQTN